MRSRFPTRAPALLILLSVLAGPGEAQESLDRARQLRDAGRFDAATEEVRTYLEGNPDDAGARWMLGQLLHWNGEHRAARRAYEEARALGLDDPWMELEYAGVLLALEDWDQAGAVLEGVADRGPPDARIQARTLLGTLAYWDGDLSEAARRLEAVLDESPDHAEAARQLREIREMTRPWVRSRLELLDDNQPFRRYHLAVEGGRFLTPLWSLAAGGAPRVTDAGTAESSGHGWLELRGFLPELQAEISVRGGAALAGGSTRGGSTWTGRGALAFRLPTGLKLQASARRERYLWTRASADTLLMVRVLEIALDRSEAPGWAGKAGVQRESFPDGNPVGTAYAWLLAPVQPWLRVGYAFSWSDAEESTWTAAAGRYDPYFTPEETRIHALLAELSGSLGPGTARLSGEWGIAAEEKAPVLTGSAPGPPTLDFVHRDYTPWSLAASWTAPLAENVTFDVRGEHRETAFYALTGLETGFVYRFSHGR